MKKVNKMKQTNGKDNDAKLKSALENYWGETVLSQYQTLDEKKYEKSLSDMNMADLHTHAASVGLQPIDNRRVLVERLVREFQGTVFKHQNPPGFVHPQPKISKKVQKILDEGK